LVAGVIELLQRFIHDVHAAFAAHERASKEAVWEAYVSEVEKTIAPYERAHAGANLMPVRAAGEIFVSVAAYRDHMLANTLHEIFANARDATKVVAGVVMQNCAAHCRTGVQVVSAPGAPVRTAVSDAPPDPDGVAEFCATPFGAGVCARGGVRLLRVNESESLGPAFARFLASKLWAGEELFVQIDAHMWFVENWDDQLRAELRGTPSYPKSVLSVYPPGPDDQGNWKGGPSGRLCSSSFSKSPVESDILRLDQGGARPSNLPHAPYSVFVAAGFFAAHASFLATAPYDPFLPFVFMGEELLLTARLWTNGWDVYSPRKNLCAHQYRPGKLGLPKFWETTARTFGGRGNFNNEISGLIIDRVKAIAGYPSLQGKDDLPVLAHVHDAEAPNYGLGLARSLEDFLEYAHIDMQALQSSPVPWCVQGDRPTKVYATR